MGIRISRLQVWQRPCICITYILEKINNSLSWSLGLLFSLFTWTLDMTFVTLVTSKFGLALKKWHINMYHMHIWKNELLPVLIPRVAVLVVSLDPRYCLCHTCNLEIRIPIEKLTYKHVSHQYLKKMNNSLSWSLGLPFSLFPWNLNILLLSPLFNLEIPENCNLRLASTMLTMFIWLQFACYDAVWDCNA